MNSKLMVIISVVILITTLNITSTVAISKPDLVANSLEATLTNVITSSGDIKCYFDINITIENNGNITSTIVPIIVRDLTTNTILLSKSLSNLGDGEINNATFSNTEIIGVGMHTLSLEVNPIVNSSTGFRIIDEFDTTNNDIEREIECVHQLRLPDLTISNTDISIISEPNKDKLRIDFTVKNIGNGSSTSASVQVAGPRVTYRTSIEPLAPNEEKNFTIIRDITGELINSQRGKALQIGKEYEIRIEIFSISPTDVNPFNNRVIEKFTYTTEPRAGIFITPLSLLRGQQLSIQLCAEEPLTIQSSTIIDPIGDAYYNLEQTSLDTDECHVLYSEKFEDLKNKQFRSSIDGLYTIIIDTDKGPIYGEYMGNFFVLPESFIGTVGLIGAAIGTFVVYRLKKDNRF